MTEQAVQPVDAAENDPDVLDYLVRRFGHQVYKVAYYHVRDRYLAEDIAQEVFCRVYRNLSRFRGESTYYTWLYRITVNLCRDYMTSADRTHMLPWRSMESGVSVNDEARMFEEAEGGEVFASVMSLPAKYRTVISLYYYEDMTTGDIAKTLDISEVNVRTRLSRGREMLKRVLEDIL